MERLFGEVLIPQAVFNELTLGERFQKEAEQIKRKIYYSKVCELSRISRYFKKSYGFGSTPTGKPVGVVSCVQLPKNKNEIPIGTIGV